MIPKDVVSELVGIVGRKYVIENRIEKEAYASDGTKLSYLPDAVVLPKSSAEISRILLLAARNEVPVIPRGAGSGMTGGALAVNGGLVMAMHRMNRILAIDQDNLVAKVEPGVITADLQAEVERRHLFYPPDPASLNISSIGGNVAECAGGLRAVKYGVTRDYVLGLTMVLPTGQKIRTGVRTVKGVAGYDLTRLIVGSEGTLAVITEITLKLLPLPEAQKTMIAFFPDVASCVQTVSSVIRKGIVPTILEFLDRSCLQCVRHEMRFPIPEKAGAMLLIEVDGDWTDVHRDADRIRRVCLEGGSLYFEAAASKQEAHRLWEARRKVSPSLYQLKPHKVSEDIVVPRSRMAELVIYLEGLAAQHSLPIPAFGHAGDGNIHVNIMHDKENPAEVAVANDLIRLLFEKVIALGGTITGEHGIGITKSPYLEMEISRPAIELMTRIKHAFDPQGILNPGKIFPVKASAGGPV
jgi:glycolate oxidase